MNDLKELKELVADIAKGGEAIFNDFSPANESTYQSDRINKVRYIAGRKSYYMVLNILATPFNPFTGEVTANHKEGGFTVIPMMPTKAAAFIKNLCYKDEKLKKIYEKHAKVKSGAWIIKPLERKEKDSEETVKYDLPIPEEFIGTDEFITDYLDFFTTQDLEIFGKFLTPMSKYVSTAKVSSKVSGSTYGLVASIGTKRNPVTGFYEGDITPIHQLCNLVGNLVSEEIQSYITCVNSKKPENSKSIELERTFGKEILQITNKDSEAGKKIYGHIQDIYPISGVINKRNTIGLEIVLDGDDYYYVNQDRKDSLDNNIKEIKENMDEISLKDYLVYISNGNINKEINKVTGNPRAKEPIARDIIKDTFFNFTLWRHLSNDDLNSLSEDQLANNKKDFNLSDTPDFAKIQSITGTADRYINYGNDVAREALLTFAKLADKVYSNPDVVEDFVTKIENSYPEIDTKLFENIAENITETISYATIKEHFSNTFDRNSEVIGILYQDESQQDAIEDFDIDDDSEEDTRTEEEIQKDLTQKANEEITDDVGDEESDIEATLKALKMQDENKNQQEVTVEDSEEETEEDDDDIEIG